MPQFNDAPSLRTCTLKHFYSCKYSGVPLTTTSVFHEKPNYSVSL